MEQKFTIFAITRIPHDPLSSLQPVLSVAMSTLVHLYILLVGVSTPNPPLR